MLMWRSIVCNARSRFVSHGANGWPDAGDVKRPARRTFLVSGENANVVQQPWWWNDDTVVMTARLKPGPQPK